MHCHRGYRGLETRGVSRLFPNQSLGNELSHVLILHDEALRHIGKTGVTDLCDLNTFGDFKPPVLHRPVIK